MAIATTGVIAETLNRAAVRATLAPSIHNTQPWTFVLRPDSLEVHSDSTRQLGVLDPRSRQLTISCGCAIFNARVAIAAAGFEPLVEYFPDAYHPDILARIHIGEHREWIPIAALDDAIDRRRTNRRRFADEPVPHSLVYDLVAAARAEGADLIPITRPEHRQAATKLSELADNIESSDPAYLAELEAWTSDDPRRLDGVQAATVPYVGTEPAHAEDVLPIRAFDVRGMGWLPAATTAETNECLLLLACADDGPAAWLRAGEALEHVWLELTRQGYWASPLSQVVEVAVTHERLRAELGLDVNPEILLRVGHAPETMPTRRRRHTDVIVYAR
jgi:nitroreductase